MLVVLLSHRSESLAVGPADANQLPTDGDFSRPYADRGKWRCSNPEIGRINRSDWDSPEEEGGARTSDGVPLTGACGRKQESAVRSNFALSHGGTRSDASSADI